MRGNIVNLVRAHFLLPEGKEMRNAILKRIGKAWKNHRYALKKDYFDPVEKTREQNYASIPDRITTQNWSFLVDYWLSSDAKKLEKLLVRRKFLCAGAVLKAMQIAELFWYDYHSFYLVL